MVCIYVGDSEVDAETAKNDVPFLLLRRDIEKHRLKKSPTYSFSSFNKLRLVEKILEGTNR